MKPVVKGFLIGCPILLILAVVAVVVVIRFLDRTTKEYVAKGQDVRAEGKQFGQNVSEPKCVEEAMSRYRRKTGIVGGIEQGVWLGGCLDESAFDSAFCEGVPRQEDLVRSATWRVERCAAFGLPGDSTCPTLLGQMQTYCESEERKEKAISRTR